MNRPLCPALPIVLADDEPHMLQSYSVFLRTSGFDHLLATEDGREVVPLLKKNGAAAVVLDLSMPHIAGLELLAEINREFPLVPVVVATATDDLQTAVECMRGGAFDYLVKPVETRRFLSAVQKALHLPDLRQEVSPFHRHLPDGPNRAPAFSSIVTNSEKMTTLFRDLEAIVRSQQPILIAGETGVGKELIARAAHELGARKGRFVAVNIAGLDDTLFSDALFGHKRGAFTGAERDREGLIAQAAGGTLFLDEIGELREASQVKLLRLLQELKYFPLGSDLPRSADARVVAATNQDIRKLMRDGRFRPDLYYRLCGHQVQVPALRERIADLPLLLNHFLGEAAASLGKKTPSYPEELVTLLSTYHFPGNIRELQAMIFDAVARHRHGVLSLACFKKAMGVELENSPPPADQAPQGPGLVRCSFARFPTLKQAEQYFIDEALRLSHGNQGVAAVLLGMTRQALNKRLIRKNQQSSDTASSDPLQRPIPEAQAALFKTP